jgi:hypothetical protein
MLKVGPVDIIECVIQSEVRTHDLHRDNVVHRQSRGLNGRLYTIHDELRFNPGIFRGPVSLRIYTDMTGNIKGVTNKHSVAKWQRRARSTARSIYKLSIRVRISLAGTEGKEEGKCTGNKRLRIPKALNVRFRANASASMTSVGPVVACGGSRLGDGPRSTPKPTGGEFERRESRRLREAARARIDRGAVISGRRRRRLRPSQRCCRDRRWE